MFSTDDLIRSFHSLNVTDDDTINDDYEAGYNEGYDNGYKEGYNYGYDEGYEHGRRQITNPIMKRNVGRPAFGWQIKDNQLVENVKEQIVIEMIRRVLLERPNISINDICKILTYHHITIRRSKRIYPATIKNIILANNL